jgi:hypothetical protein
MVFPHAPAAATRATAAAAARSKRMGTHLAAARAAKASGKCRLSHPFTAGLRYTDAS